MSSIQKRLWFLEQVEAAAGVHNIVAVYRLQPDVELDRLRQAFTELALQHEILRTAFMSVHRPSPTLQSNCFSAMRFHFVAA